MRLRIRERRISTERGPLSRITPIALRPGGVATATMVSIAVWNEQE